MGKVFNDGLNKKDKTKKVGILKRLKNIEDNLNSNDDDDNGYGKVGIFQIIKDIKDKGIKISNDDEAIREIKEHIQNLRNEGINVNINNVQINDLVNNTFTGIGKRDSTPQDSIPQDSTPTNLDIKNVLLIHKEPIKTRCSSDIFGNHNIDTKEINKALINYVDKTITPDEFLQMYDVFINGLDEFSKVVNKNKLGAMGPDQKELLN